MPEELIQADIEQAFFEYRANFNEPLTMFWASGKQAGIVDALSKVLAKWGVGFENISWNSAPSNLAQIQVTFAIPSLFASIQVGVAGITMTALNPDWSRADALVAAFGNSLKVLSEKVEQKFQSQQATLAFHIKPTAKPFREIVSSFINSKALDGSSATMFGVSAYYGDHAIVMDSSAIVPGGLFIKLVRIFTTETQLPDMAKVMYEDEVKALNRLGLKLQ
jgi:hypothetical protein